MENAKHAAQERPIAKRLVTFVTAVAACVALVAGGTLAYFSAEETAHNVITTGGVDIELVEWMDEGKTAQWSEDNPVPIMPGTVVTKIVEVKNVGSADAWVRVKVDKSFKVGEESRDASVVVPDLPAQAPSSEPWAYREADGYWYYTKPLAPGAVTEQPLFKSVKLLEGTGNDYQNGTATVTVSAQAVQYDNNNDSDGDGVESVFEAAGWPAE